MSIRAVQYGTKHGCFHRLDQKLGHNGPTKYWMRRSLSTLWSIHSNAVEQSTFSQLTNHHQLCFQNSKLVTSQPISTQSKRFVAHSKADNDSHALSVLPSIANDICSINSVKMAATFIDWDQRKRPFLYRRRQTKAIHCKCPLHKNKNHRSSSYRPHRKVEAWCRFSSKVAH